MNMQISLISQVSYITLSSIFYVFALEASSFHITLVYAEHWTRIGIQTYM